MGVLVGMKCVLELLSGLKKNVNFHLSQVFGINTIIH